MTSTDAQLKNRDVAAYLATCGPNSIYKLLLLLLLLLNSLLPLHRAATRQQQSPTLTSSLLLWPLSRPHHHVQSSGRSGPLRARASTSTNGFLGVCMVLAPAPALTRCVQTAQCHSPQQLSTAVSHSQGRLCHGSSVQRGTLPEGFHCSLPSQPSSWMGL
jgi:hypothetical protein